MKTPIDSGRSDPPPRHFGDYPNGAYWSADVSDADPDEPRGIPPWVTTDERSASNPYPIRMFAEVGCDFALWGPIGEAPPTTKNTRDSADRLEERLPISESLRDLLLAWAEDHFRFDGGDRSVPMDDFDERGFLLSRALQRELGELYSVEYGFHFAGAHRATLVAMAQAETLPGWSCR